MSEKIEAFETAKGAYSKTFENITLIARMGWAPFGMAFVVMLLMATMIGGWIGLLVTYIATAVAAAMMSVPLYRVYLLGESAHNDVLHMVFEQREQRMTMVIAAFVFAQIAVSWIGGVSTLVSLVLAIATLFLSVRLAPIFPAVALDEPVDPGAVFQKTKGHFWPIFLTYVLIGIPLVIVGGLLGAIGVTAMFTPNEGGPTGGPGGILALAIFATLILYGFAIAVAANSKIYTAIYGEIPAAPEPEISGAVIMTKPPVKEEPATKPDAAPETGPVSAKPGSGKNPQT